MAETIPTLQELLLVHPDQRESAWEKAFLRRLSEEKFALQFPDPKPGPDGWPYLWVGVGTAQAEEPAIQVIDWLSTRGIGLAINPHKPAPDYVLSYGMIWNFRERGEFLTEAPIRRSGDIQLENGPEVLAGPPSEGWLPGYVRKILKQFLLDQSVFSPRVLMISTDGGQNYDLSFSLESLGSPPAQEHTGIAEALSWFLPAHYSIALVSEKTIPGFVEL